MNKKYDVIIVGAGIIGAAIAFEMAKLGYKTVNIDKQPAAGFGSTGNSCSVIRVHYSTWDGTAMAWESYHHWKDWQNYIEAEDERGYCRYINTCFPCISYCMSPIYMNIWYFKTC